MIYDRSTAPRYTAQEYSGFWAAAEKVAGFTAICLFTLILITIQMRLGVDSPSPPPGEFLFY